jgi:hypothetical protein
MKRRLLKCFVLDRPATKGSLDPYTPHVDVPADARSNGSAAEELPYYFATIVDGTGTANAPAKDCVRIPDATAAPQEDAVPTGGEEAGEKAPAAAAKLDAAAAAIPASAAQNGCAEPPGAVGNAPGRAAKQGCCGGKAESCVPCIIS